MAFKDDAYYDTCPNDGCLTVDRQFKSGGVDGKGGEHHDWAIFSADRREGGCGASWSRTTEQGKARNDQRGRSTGLLTDGADRGRTFFVPTDAYRDNYERAFGHG